VRVRDLNIDGCTILLNESVLLFACKRTRLAVAVEDLETGEAEGAEGTEGESEEGSEGGDA
jgi:hypothetical protein